MATMTPNALAEKLAGKDAASKVAKTFVRPFLRKNFPRAKDAKGTGWTLTTAQVRKVTDAYKARSK